MPKLSIRIVLKSILFFTVIILNQLFPAGMNPAWAQNLEKRKLFLYDDIANYPWSGFMGSGNGSSINLDMYDEEDPYDGYYSARVSTSGTESWCGIIIQSRANQWTPPGLDFSGAISVNFALKGKDGGENIRLEFMNGKYTQNLNLSNQWTEYSQVFSLGDDFTSINSLLAIVIPDNKQISFFVDEIYFEVNRFQSVAAPSFPKRIKGIGYNANDPSKYSFDFSMIRNELCANTLRFWGQSDITWNTLDMAADNNLKTILPYWLPRGDDNFEADYSDIVFCNALKRSILNYLEFYLPHASIIMLSLGNEVFHNLMPTTNENKEALARYLNVLCGEIHPLYPNLKITYAAVGSEPLEFLKSYTPNLDVYGSNAYGNIGSVIEDYQNSNYDKPLLFLEFGCFGWWEKNWYEYSDEERASDYSENWYVLRSKSIGGCAFAWTDKEENSYTGWGIVDNDRTKRAQFHALSKAYCEKVVPSILLPLVLPDSSNN